MSNVIAILQCPQCKQHRLELCEDGSCRCTYEEHSRFVDEYARFGYRTLVTRCPFVGEAVMHGPDGQGGYTARVRFKGFRRLHPFDEPVRSSA